MAGLPINAVDLFNLQQLQQLQQQQHQLEMQNYAVAMSNLNGSGGSILMKDEDVGDGGEEDFEEQQQYTGNYQYMEGSDQENAIMNEDFNSSNSSSGNNFLLNQQQQMFNMLNKNATAGGSNDNGGHTFGSRSKESFKKIKPVKRPGLVLKTPIAYQGNIDPAVIPIQRDGMGMLTLFL